MRQPPPRATPFQQNAFGALAANNLDNASAETVATQMVALTYQSQLTATTAANLSQQMGQYLQILAHQQDQLHQNQHQMMAQMAALLFNQSNAGRGIGRQGCGPPPPTAPFAPQGFRCNPYGGRSGQGHGRGRGRDHGPPAFIAGHAPTIMPHTAGRAPGYAVGLPPATGGGYYAPPPQTQQAPPLLEPHETIRKLECMLFLWF